MKVAVYHGPHRIQIEDLPRPQIRGGEDAIVQVTMTTLCGTDLHPFRGTQDKPRGFRMGHECVGVVDEVGDSVKNFRPGDRVIVPATSCCGNCGYCTRGLTSQCEADESGTIEGAQGEYVLVPYAPATLVRIPPEVSDAAALTLCDIFPTGYFGARVAGVKPGDSVAVFGAGPVGLLAMKSAELLGANRIYAVDCVGDRLEVAAREGFIPIDFSAEYPVDAISRLSEGQGVSASIECVGMAGVDRTGHPSPEQALVWAIEVTQPCGAIGVVGDFTLPRSPVPMEALMHKNLSIRAGIAHHRACIPELLEHVRTGRVDPTFVFDATFDLEELEDVYRQFERRGLLKALVLTAAGRERRERARKEEAQRGPGARVWQLRNPGFRGPQEG